MSPATISYYCFYSKSATNSKTHNPLNIYYNKNQAESAPKTNLKLTSRKFFHTSHPSRSRTYSDNSSSLPAQLETAPASHLKNSESTDKLQNILEEQKEKKQPEPAKEAEKERMKVKKVLAKMGESKGENRSEMGFTEVQRKKRHFPKGSLKGEKSRKVNNRRGKGRTRY